MRYFVTQPSALSFDGGPLARYILLRTHDWSGEVLERLQSAQKDKRRTRMPPKRRHGKRPGY